MDRAEGAGPGAAASRAERFEDEKRRIIESCFNKTDTDGSVLETYITHIRVTEYSSNPSSPPPPQARTPDSEKPRVIIVAVRKSGRVRMHKSKENTNGTFSIGKTWNLDDLSHIESYTNPQLNPQQREWAGDTGLLVTLGKPYFWQAQTDKEKKFFIASLIKIYGKYTGGKIPELSGFEQKELDQVLGAGGRRPGPPSRPSDATLSPPTTQSPPSNASPPPPSRPSVASDNSRLHKPPSRPFANGRQSPAPSYDSSTSRDRSQPRWVAQNNKSQDSVATSFATRSEDASSLPPRSRNGMAVPGAPGRFGEPREPTDPTQEMPPLPPQGRVAEEGVPPPERRRPPMDPARPQDRDLVPPPLMSSPNLRKDSTPSLRNAEPTAPVAMEKTVSQKSAPDAMPDVVRGRDNESSGMKSLNSAKSAPAPAPIDAPAPGDAISPPVQSPTSEEETKPGLGPMMRSKKSKGEIAGSFWKAATAASAFKPRPGGAADRLRNAQNKMMEGPDGITGVVPAPPRAINEQRPATPEVPPLPTTVGTPPAPAAEPRTPTAPKVPSSASKEASPQVPREAPPVPDVKLSVPDSNLATNPPEQIKDVKKAEEAKPARRTPSAVKDTKYLQALGIDPKLLDDRSEEFGKWLDFFGWVPGDQMRSRNMDELKVDIDRELNKAQAGGWLARFREEDDRVDAIKRGIDVAMSECEEMDNLLTLYSVELSTLSEDIAYIEAQGQGLQVQTANQKLLKKELESLLETCAITTHDLEALRVAPLENIRGLQDIEASLITLYRAMMKIDPSLGDSELGNNAVKKSMDGDSGLGLNSDYGQMRIVQEKKEMYMQESSFFMRRLVEFMARQFDEAFSETRRALEGALSKKIDASHHDAGRDVLWKYGPLMLYARDADLANCNRLMQIYQDKAHPVYKNEFQTVVTVWRKNARKMTGEEAELLFTFQMEKQQEGVATTAKKMTVKRSQTLARALRSPLADSHKHSEKRTADSRNMPYEVFLGVLDDLLPLVEMEQNFIIDFFHATTLEQIDFPDSVAASTPRDRRGGDLKRHRLMEPDRELARRVTRSMEVIFSFLELEIQRLIEWVIGQDPLQGVGVLAILDKRLGEIGQSNQDFLNMLLQKLHDGLETRFVKFVDEQIHAIEETKVKINKRKGVISFIRVFPAFMTAVENMLAGSDPNSAPRRIIDREYDRILKSMFDSLMVIAREHPTAGLPTGGSADPEGKEALNFHILLIENMNHFLEETESNNLEILEEWKEQANSEYHEHMDLYLDAVMRRPLGKLLDQLENIEAQIQSGKVPLSIARQPSNNKSIFSKILSMYDSKEVRKGIEALKKRVDKHFGDADDPTVSRGLVTKVLNECENYYGKIETRIGRITTDVYGGDVPFEWPRADVKAAFR